MIEEPMTQDRVTERSDYNLCETTLTSTAMVSASNVIDQCSVLNDFKNSHPTFLMSRQLSTEVERQNININVEYGDSIAKYMRELEL